ncbi:hypothetical protein BC332_15987 [Capsicum chinense]|nr:hypothetical protein BC332_15987 [Capsicum chinense]
MLEPVTSWSHDNNFTREYKGLGCTDEEKIFSGYLPTDPYFIPKISSKSVSHFDGSVDIELTSQSSNSLPDATPKGTPSLLSYPLLRRSNIKYVFDGEIRRKTPKSPHQHLSEVQCRGYFGDINDVELAMYFFENTLALEKFIVDPCVELQHNCEDSLLSAYLSVSHAVGKKPTVGVVYNPLIDERKMILTAHSIRLVSSLGKGVAQGRGDGSQGSRGGPQGDRIGGQIGTQSSSGQGHLYVVPEISEAEASYVVITTSSLRFALPNGICLHSALRFIWPYRDSPTLSLNSGYRDNKGAALIPFCHNPSWGPGCDGHPEPSRTEKPLSLPNRPVILSSLGSGSHDFKMHH